MLSRGRLTVARSPCDQIGEAVSLSAGASGGLMASLFITSDVRVRAENLTARRETASTTSLNNSSSSESSLRSTKQCSSSVVPDTCAASRSSVITGTHGCCRSEEETQKC